MVRECGDTVKRRRKGTVTDRKNWQKVIKKHKIDTTYLKK